MLPALNLPQEHHRTNAILNMISSMFSRPPLVARTSSSTSVPLVGAEDDGPVTVEGLAHAGRRLEARKYKTAQFAESALAIIRDLAIPSWRRVNDASQLQVFKVSGSLTNAVFFVSAPRLQSASRPHTLLLRIYGPSSGSLISRPRELRTLHVLSSQYHIGPRVYGTFENGRIEEYFESSALTAEDLRQPAVSRWIGMRMAELHCVDIDVVEESAHPLHEEGKSWDVACKKNVREWTAHARGVLALPAFPDAARREIDFDAFLATWGRYLAWLAAFEAAHGKSPRVFAHNDTQYGNLLRMNSPKPGTPEHRQIVVVDFEYAAPNAAAFDIANHFHEWTANYHGPTPHLLEPARYPTLRERENFYAAYLGVHAPDTPARPDDLRALDALVRAWSPASHGMWAVWALVQARDTLEQPSDGEPEFDYIAYAHCRLELFRRGVEQLEI